MLVRITHKCRMNCPHCMVEASPSGEHMTMETFRKIIDFIDSNTLSFMLVSGGEPMDHPRALEFLSVATERLSRVVMLSNGMFLEDDALREEVIRLGIWVQVTADPRFYKTRIEKFDHPLFRYEDRIRTIIPLGRAVANEIKCDKQAPTCFNLRSVTRSTGDVREAIKFLRQGAKMCTPSINVDGTIVAGESPLCHKIGTIDSTPEELTANLERMRCNKCGLEDKLSVMYKHAIGLYD